MKQFIEAFKALALPAQLQWQLITENNLIFTNINDIGQVLLLALKKEKRRASLF